MSVECCSHSVLNAVPFPPQIFKTAEELDLGCGVGGGKDSKDIFKVGISNAAPL